MWYLVSLAVRSSPSTIRSTCSEFFVLAADFIAALTVLNWRVYKHFCHQAPGFFCFFCCCVLVFVAYNTLFAKNTRTLLDNMTKTNFTLLSSLLWSTINDCRSPFCWVQIFLVRVQLVAFPVISIIRWKQQTVSDIRHQPSCHFTSTLSCVCNHSRVYCCVATVDFWLKVNTGSQYSIPQ